MGPRKKHRFINDIEEKHCSKCDTWKSLAEYNRQASSWDMLSRMCRLCYIEYKRVKRETDSKYKRSDELYRESYKESGRRREVSQLRYERKREEIINKCKKYNKKRYQEDPYFRTIFLTRSRMSRILRERNIGNKNKYYDLLGCTKNEFIIYFEKLFTEGMSWELMGKYIHVDHIRPCCAFDLTDEDELKKCFHYTNLQPLWAKDNLSKGGRCIRETWHGTTSR